MRMQCIQDELGNMFTLETLGLSDIQLTVLPPVLAQLPNLQKLRLEHNRLPERRLSPEWDQLLSLQTLHLNGNRLTGPLPLDRGIFWMH